MSLRIDSGVKVAKSGVRAVRKSAGQALQEGRSRLRDVLAASEVRATNSLNAAEKVLVGVVDALAQGGRSYENDGRDRLHGAEARLISPRRRPRIATAVLAVGAGVLLSLLLRKPQDREA
jgi:hypothetical protein